MTSRKIGLFLTPPTPIVTFFITKAMSSQNLWHSLPLKPWRHYWTTPYDKSVWGSLQFGQIYYLSSSFSSIANFGLWESWWVGFFLFNRWRRRNKFVSTSNHFKYSQTCVNDHLPITTTCQQRPQFGCPIFNFYNKKLPLNNDHLSTTATSFESRGWSLYTGLTVLLKVFFSQPLKSFTVKLGYNEQLRTGHICSL